MVEIEFTPKGPRSTAVRLTHSMLKSRGDYDDIKVGWSDALDRLKKLFEDRG